MIADSIIRPLGQCTRARGFFNKKKLDNARYVLVQNNKESADGAGGLVRPRTCFVFIHKAIIGDGLNFSNTRVMAVKGDTDSFIIKKEPNEYLFAQNNETPNGDPNLQDNSPNGILFTKISNPWEEGREDDNEF